MKTYLAYVYKDPTSSFGVAFPDLPGCYGAGETYDEALESAKISLREYALAVAEDGKDLPKSRSHSELAGDAAESLEFDRTAFVAEIPLLTVGSRRRVNVSMDGRILAALDRAAALAGVNRSVLLAEAAKDWMKANLGAVVVEGKKKKARKSVAGRAKAKPATG